MNTRPALASWRKVPGWLRSKLSYPIRMLRDLLAARRYACEMCDLRTAPSGREAPTSPLRLGVVGGFPVLGYVHLGYDYLASYYNPLLFFEEVHYFQNIPNRIKFLNWGYPFYIHYFENCLEIVRICEKYQISILRAYDPVNGRIAIEAARVLNIPVIVSVH